MLIQLKQTQRQKFVYCLFFTFWIFDEPCLTNFVLDLFHNPQLPLSYLPILPKRLLLGRMGRFPAGYGTGLNDKSENQGHFQLPDGSESALSKWPIFALD